MATPPWPFCFQGTPSIGPCLPSPPWAAREQCPWCKHDGAPRGRQAHCPSHGGAFPTGMSMAQIGAAGLCGLKRLLSTRPRAGERDIIGRLTGLGAALESWAGARAGVSPFPGHAACSCVLLVFSLPCHFFFSSFPPSPFPSFLPSPSPPLSPLTFFSLKC